MTHSLESKLVMLAELTITLDLRDEFLEYAAKNMAISRAAPGNVQFEILADEARADQMVFYEVWESREAQQAYLQWRVERGDLVTLMSFLAGPPKFNALRSIMP